MSGISEYSTVPSSNTTVNGISIAEGCAPGNVNDAMRQIMADIAGFSAGIMGGATTSSGGMMSAADKQKLDGIASGANVVTVSAGAANNGYIYVGGTKSLVYSLPAATASSLGGVKVGAGLSVTSAGELSVPVMSGATTTSAGKKGLVPAPAKGGAGRFLAADGTWKVPDGTTYAVMTGATASSAGKAGLAPKPAAGAATRFLCADGTWKVPNAVVVTSASSAGTAKSAETAETATSAGRATSAGSAGATPNVRMGKLAGRNSPWTCPAGTWAYIMHGTNADNNAAHYYGSATSGTKVCDFNHGELFGVAIRIK